MSFLKAIPWKYAARKCLLAIPLLWGVLTIIFVLLELAPGDASTKFINPEFPPEVKQMVIEKYGLDKPAWWRYLLMIGNVAVFDFGRSITAERPVWDLVADALPNTIILSTVTLIVAYPTGILLGTWQGIRQNKPDDTAISLGSLLFYSMPSFWLAMMLQLFVAYYFSNYISGIVDAGGPEWLNVFNFDVTGMYSNELLLYMSSDQPWTWAQILSDPIGAYHERFDWWLERNLSMAHHLILPGVAMGLASSAGAARYMRSSLLEVIRQDYIRTARAKGLAERVVILKHAMRNALLPIITLLGLSIPFLFSGSVLVEMVFAWPGMGRLIVTSIFTQDTPTIIACFFVSTLLVVAGNLISDVSYALVDPRIRYD
jgi:peptide/nickel transport system permease protein